MTTSLNLVAFALLVALALALYRHARSLQGHNAALQRSLDSEKRRADTLLACAGKAIAEMDALALKYAHFGVRAWQRRNYRALYNWKVRGLL